ncbi:hypothetical protein N183_27185 [Sinorhizobium sp. Sb3]|nr:hypothetical protein N183_27185 [Sinorhizobium sp. Sb3]
MFNQLPLMPMKFSLSLALASTAMIVSPMLMAKRSEPLHSLDRGRLLLLFRVVL